jgi:hypothetical protein
MRSKKENFINIDLIHYLFCDAVTYFNVFLEETAEWKRGEDKPYNHSKRDLIILMTLCT